VVVVVVVLVRQVGLERINNLEELGELLEPLLGNKLVEVDTQV